MKKQIEINFIEVKAKDLMGEEISIPNLHEQIGNQLYRTAYTIPVADAARILFKGQSYSADQDSIIEMIKLLDKYFIPIVDAALMNYLNEKLNKLKQEQEDGNNTSI